MQVMVLVREGLWQAAVDSARSLAPDDAGITLVHLASGDVEEVMHGAANGLLGRRRPHFEAAEAGYRQAAEDLLAAARARLGRTCTTSELSGRRVEQQVVAAVEDADLLVMARDGDRSRLGPHSLGPVSRFIVDHAPCPILLVWPGAAPSTGTI